VKGDWAHDYLHPVRLTAYCRDGPPERPLAVFAVFFSELSAIDVMFAAETLARCGHQGRNNSEENSGITAKQQPKGLHRLPGAALFCKVAGSSISQFCLNNEWQVDITSLARYRKLIKARLDPLAVRARSPTPRRGLCGRLTVIRAAVSKIKTYARATGR